MLREQNLDHGCFGETELTALLEVGGWEAILPSALKDRQLLAVANQMRDLVLDQHADASGGTGSAALAMTLLLIAVTEPKRWGPGDHLNIEMETLHDVLELLSARIDQEIVDRVLQRRNERSDVTLIQAIRELTR
ncbi:hypothetical protein [Acidovorax sp. JHL-3]|jgi:hypothetical protein|uniref:hypothetical protein n=1 Tax=Acidovorax sp. JHL-3 TaxID=1276755 RepID=UPI000464403E|nr:hypothetical protein [Acidovorax sp. JHL-3]